MIFGLIARGLVWAVEAVQLLGEGIGAGRRLVKAARQGKLPTPSVDATEPFPLTFKDASRINQAARQAGHEAPSKKAK